MKTLIKMIIVGAALAMSSCSKSEIVEPVVSKETEKLEEVQIDLQHAVANVVINGDEIGESLYSRNQTMLKTYKVEKLTSLTVYKTEGEIVNVKITRKDKSVVEYRDITELIIDEK